MKNELHRHEATSRRVGRICLSSCREGHKETKVISDEKNTYVDEFRLTSAALGTSRSTLDHSVG
ncbi:MAG: hypothetical protein V7L20_31435 [Nostoc sp.]|uniref:hypothetical protein n=1 Tax=Nostoc sp. TaxID=1180 RepID=UPI002FF8F67E